MLEPMSRSAAKQPDVFRRGMPIHNEMIIRSLFVLAYSCLDQGRIFHRRKSKRKILTNGPEAIRTHHPLPCGRIE